MSASTPPEPRFHPRMQPSEFLAEWLRDPALAGDTRSLFDSYYRSYLRSFPLLLRRSYDRRLQPALRILTTLAEGSRVLEIGAGCGTESLYFSLLGAHVTAVEVVQEMVAVAQARKVVLETELGRPLPLEFIHTDVLKFQPAAPFDLIWMEEAFHHMEPRDRVVPAVVALLKPGGHLVVAETNPFNPLVQAYLLRDRGLPHVEERRDASGERFLYGAERVLAPSRLDRWFRQHGVAMVEAEYHRFFPNRGGGGRWIERLDAAGHRWLPRFLKRFCCVHYNYVGVKGASPGTE